MSGNINRTQEASRSITVHEAVIHEVEDAMKRLRISPIKVLGSLSHLRIDRARIKPIESQAPKAGGKAVVEAATLASREPSSSSEPDDTTYVAVKKLILDEYTDDNRALAALAHEVNLLNDLSHKNVVKIIGFVEEVGEGVAWMVFAWEKNGNLREFIRSAKWELPERVFLIDDVARGVSYLHGRNPPICHGDLKSLNVLVNSERRAVITDFGSARAVGSAEEATSENVHGAKPTSPSHLPVTGGQSAEPLTAEIAPSGEFITMTGPAWTIRWAAPELLEGHLPGLASDIWALGWICWEAVTGNFPFDTESDTAVVLHITRGDLPTIENDDQLKQIKTLCSLMRDCWRLDTSERPTAEKCQQIMRWMDQTVPSGSEGSSSTASRSSGLLFALGWVQLRNDRYRDAREYFERSLKVAGSIGDERSKARALKGIGDTFQLQDEHSKAETLYVQARDIYSRIADERGSAQTIKSLGDVHFMLDEYSKAEESYIQARDIYTPLGDQLGLAQSVKSLGDVYRMRAEYTKAEESYFQAREIYSQIGNQLGLAQTIKSVGDVHFMRDEYSKAEELYIQARGIYSQIGDQLGVAQSVKSLGELCCMRADYPKAEELYIQAGEISSQIGNQLGLAQSLDGLGDVYRMQSDYSKAENSYMQARKIFGQIGDQLGFAQSSEGMGRLQALRGEYAKAEESYSAAQRIYQRIGDVRSSANILWCLGWLHRNQGHYGTAEGLVGEASTIYGNLGLTQLVEECNEFLEAIRRLM